MRGELTKCDEEGVPLLVQSFSLSSNWHRHSYDYTVVLFNGKVTVVDVSSIPVPINLSGVERDEFIFRQLNSYVNQNHKEIIEEHE